MKIILTLLITLVSCLAFSGQDENIVVTYPAPASEKVLTSYKVTVNGKPIDIYKALSPQYEGGEYYFCYFDFKGEVEVNVHSTKSFTEPVSYVWSPQRKAEAANRIVGEVYPYSLNAKVSKTNASFKTNKPFKAVVIRNERAMPLIIFGNPLEKDIPNKKDLNVIYYDAGVHCVDQIELKDNQTLYVAGGAVLKTRIIANGKNIKICGRGVISTDNRERKYSGMHRFSECKNITVRDVIIKDSANWTVVMFNCDKVLIDNIKICGGRMINDDGIDICNSSNVKILNSFVRAQDDAIAIKGIYGSGKHLGNQITENPFDRKNNPACENITIKNCILWSDMACIFRIGYECEAPYFKNISIKNISVPFYSVYRQPQPDFNWVHSVILLQATNQMPITNVHAKKINVRSNTMDYPIFTAVTQTVTYPAEAPCTIPGSIADCSVENVTVDGKKGKFNGEVFLSGKTTESSVNNIKISNFTYFGNKMSAENLKYNVSGFVKGVKIFNSEISTY